MWELGDHDALYNPPWGTPVRTYIWAIKIYKHMFIFVNTAIPWMWKTEQEIVDKYANMWRRRDPQAGSPSMCQVIGSTIDESGAYMRRQVKWNVRDTRLVRCGIVKCVNDIVSNARVEWWCILWRLWWHTKSLGRWHVWWWQVTQRVARPGGPGQKTMGCTP